MKILQAAFVVVFASAALCQPPLVSVVEKKEPVIIGHDKVGGARVAGDACPNCFWTNRKFPVFFNR